MEWHSGQISIPIPVQIPILVGNFNNNVRHWELVEYLDVFLDIASWSLWFRDMTKILPCSLVQISKRIIVFLVLSLLFLNLVNKEKEIHIKYELLVSIRIENVHFFQHNYRNIFYDGYDTTDKFCKCIFSITFSFYVECTITIFKKKILNQL